MATQTEKKRVSEAYIVEFYNDVMALTRWCANYITIGLELDGKYGDKIKDSLSESEISEMREILKNLRYHILKSYIFYESIMESIDQADKINMRLGALYTQFNISYNIKKDELLEYVKLINKIFLENVELKSLIENSLTMISDIYGEQQQQNPSG